MNEIQEENKENIDKKTLTKDDLLRFHEKEKSKGVCYMSRIPQKMNVLELRKLLEKFKIDRVYLEPKKTNKTSQTYSEGWIEFEDKRVAKMVAKRLNGTQISQYITNKSGRRIPCSIQRFGISVTFQNSNGSISTQRSNTNQR